MAIEFYELKRVTLPERGPDTFATAALITCGLCGDAIDGCGGPGHGQVCIRCGDVVRRGEARGAIKWDK